MSLEAETRRAAAYQALGFLRALVAAEEWDADILREQASVIVHLADKEQE
jgi:hypothetical protein